MMNRRILLAAAGATAALSPRIVRAQTTTNPFTLGVASGSPRDTRVVLWTRLAPNPLQGGGMAPGRAEVRVRVARDAALKSVIIDRMVETSDAKAHAVHFTAEGLEPGREYFYQFSYGDAESPIGRTRTTDPKADQARIALAYCQHYEAGFYAAHRDIAEWAPDCVIHTGDYIYEGGASPSLGAQMRDVGGGERRLFEIVRQHNGPEIVTLWDYRNRYALYKSDPDLQAAHAAAPWLCSLDDHEIDNNWAGDVPQDPEKQTALEFQIRKLAALQAWYEHMPVEEPPVLKGIASSLKMHGLYRFGPAQVHLLDTRQFRSDQACGDGRKPMCAEADDPKRSMLGLAQEKWLYDALARSAAPQNVIVTQIWFTPYRYADAGQFAFATGGSGAAAPAAPGAPVVNLDSWDGYPAARQRLADVLARGVANPTFLTGDWHTAMASSLHQSAFDAKSKRIGVELVGSSISSGCPWARDMEQARGLNPAVKHLNGKSRGYLRATFTKDACVGDFRIVTDAGRRASPVTTDVTIKTSDL